MIDSLHAWFSKEKREFPWREAPSPYRVWISEVMLQQTRAAVVVPYFSRWMKRFPTIFSLAEAPLEEVLKMWEGLGYYSRARNLHAAAKDVVQRFSGKLPSSYEELRSIAGIGAYTAGAILSFAFFQRAPAVDGNVLRVMSRYLGIEERVDASSVQKRIFQEVEKILCFKTPWVTMEALIELGATLCLPKQPRCTECPLQQKCAAKKAGKETSLPTKGTKPKTVFLDRVVFLLLHKDEVLLKKGEMGEIMQDLYQFPFVEKKELSSPEKAEEWIEAEMDCKALYERSLPSVCHTFTRYKATLYPLVFSVQDIRGKKGLWVAREDLKRLTFAGGHREIARWLGERV